MKLFTVILFSSALALATQIGSARADDPVASIDRASVALTDSSFVPAEGAFQAEGFTLGGAAVPLAQNEDLIQFSGLRWYKDGRVVLLRKGGLQPFVLGKGPFPKLRDGARSGTFEFQLAPGINATVETRHSMRFPALRGTGGVTWMRKVAEQIHLGRQETDYLVLESRHYQCWQEGENGENGAWFDCEW